jgi:hypothetical protein
MTNVTAFLTPLLGGALIGISATLLLATLGRVAGISGIVGNLVALRRASESWQLGFVIGLLAVGWLLLGRAHATFGAVAPAVSVAAGLLVGFGTRLGNGCTSGHGVCGLSRFSLRSLIATGTFIITAMVVVAFSRHVFGAGAP